jgi:hypothetical protein
MRNANEEEKKAFADSLKRMSVPADGNIWELLDNKKPLNQLDYKGYITFIHYSVQDEVLYGKIENTTDLISFESQSVENIKQEFQNAVDDYLDFCKELGEEPNI